MKVGLRVFCFFFLTQKRNPLTTFKALNPAEDTLGEKMSYWRGE